MKELPQIEYDDDDTYYDNFLKEKQSEEEPEPEEKEKIFLT